MTVVQERLVDAVHTDLYAWQRDAMQAWYDAGHHGVVEAVTGAGKTRVGIAAMKDAVAQGRRVLVVVPTIELQSQWVHAIQPHFEDLEIGRLGGGHDESFSENHVVVAVVNTAATRDGREEGLLKGIFSGLLIADEVHRYAAPQFVKALSEQFDWRLGLTATYTRPDGLEGDNLDPYFGGVVFTLWYERAIADGVVAPYRVALAGVPLMPDERIHYEEASHAMVKTLAFLEKEEAVVMGDPQMFARLQWLAQGRGGSPATAGVAARYLKAVSDRQAILAQAQAKTQVLGALATVVGESAGALVFSATVGSSEENAQQLVDAGVPAVAIHSEMKAPQRRVSLSGFKRGLYRAIAAPRVLDEGIDVPEADLGIVLGGQRQRRQVIQRLGRVIRRKPDGRPGRFVYVYAEGTIEDPAMGEQSHLDSVLEFAQEWRAFSLPREVPGLLRFLRTVLRPSEPSARVVRTSAGIRRIGQPEAVRDQQPGPVPEPAPAREPNLVPEPQPEPAPESPSEPAPVRMRAPDVLTRRRATVRLTDDIVADMRRQFGRCRLLTAEEEVWLAQGIEAGLYAEHLLEEEARCGVEHDELGRVVKEGREAQELFLMSNMRLVVSLAKRYQGRGLELPDLIQEGYLGLHRAVQKFDYTKGIKFSTYATSWIKQGLGRAVGDQGRVIRLPIHLHDEVTMIRQARAAVVEEAHVRRPRGRHAQRATGQASSGGSRSASKSNAGCSLSGEDLELARALDMEPERLALADRAVAMQPVSLDVLREFNTASGDALLDELVDPCEARLVAPDPEDLLEADLAREALHGLLDRLTAREASVLSMRFGMEDDVPRTLDAIGRHFGVTRERIRQIETQALAKLATALFDAPAGEQLHLSDLESDHALAVAGKLRLAKGHRDVAR